MAWLTLWQVYPTLMLLCTVPLLECLPAAGKCNATSMTGDEAADIVWGSAELDVGLDGDVLQSMLAEIE